MATLCLGDVDCAAPLLREWLGGDWGMLFSHPADFEDAGLEQDRWLEILRDAFAARGVRPIACRRPAGDADAGWAGQLRHDHRLVRIGPGADAAPDMVDPAAMALREQILAMPPRFVLIVDDRLQRRGLLSYAAGHSQVSPLDLLASVAAMRRRVVPLAGAPTSRSRAVHVRAVA